MPGTGFRAANRPPFALGLDRYGCAAAAGSETSTWELCPNLSSGRKSLQISGHSPGSRLIVRLKANYLNLETDLTNKLSDDVYVPPPVGFVPPMPLGNHENQEKQGATASGQDSAKRLQETVSSKVAEVEGRMVGAENATVLDHDTSTRLNSCWKDQFGL